MKTITLRSSVITENQTEAEIILQEFNRRVLSRINWSEVDKEEDYEYLPKSLEPSAIEFDDSDDDSYSAVIRLPDYFRLLSNGTIECENEFKKWVKDYLVELWVSNGSEFSVIEEGDCGNMTLKFISNGFVGGKSYQFGTVTWQSTDNYVFIHMTIQCL